MAPVALAVVAALPALTLGLQPRALKPKLIQYVGYLLPDWIPEVFEEEPVPGCEDRCRLMRAPYDDDTIRQRADAIVWNQAGGPETAGYPQERLPPRSFPAQRYVYTNNFESPRDTNKGIMLLNETIAWDADIDWTMTYRSTSDFWLPWFRAARRERVPKRLYPKEFFTTPPANHDFSAGKDKLILFMVSDQCDNPRSKIFMSIAKHLPRDRVVMKGSCSRDKYALIEWPCGGDCSYQSSDTPCMQHYFQRFKFVYAAERDRTQGWITEKMMRGFLHGMVPVFYGGLPGEDLSSYAPPNSIVNVDDFDSPEKVAEHLLALDDDDEAYNAMHAWRQEYVVVPTNKHALGLCQLCDELFKEPKKQRPRRQFGSLSRWWSEDAVAEANSSWFTYVEP